MWNADKVAFKGNEFTYRAFIGNRMVWEKEFEHLTRIRHIKSNNIKMELYRSSGDKFNPDTLEDILVNGESIGTETPYINVDKGIYTIEYILKDKTTIPDYICYISTDYTMNQYVYIPDGIKTIGDHSFFGYVSNVDLRIGNDVKTINDSAFTMNRFRNIYSYPTVPQLLRDIRLTELKIIVPYISRKAQKLIMRQYGDQIFQKGGFSLKTYRYIK